MVVRNRRRDLENHVYDFATSKVDEFLRIPPAERRTDLYRTQETIPYSHPDGYRGPGMNLRDGQLREGYDPRQFHPESRYIPSSSPDGVPLPPGRFSPGFGRWPRGRSTHTGDRARTCRTQLPFSMPKASLPVVAVGGSSLTRSPGCS